MHQINYIAMRDLDANAYDFPKSIKRFFETKKRLPTLLFFTRSSMGIGTHHANLLIMVKHLSKVIKENQ